MLIYYVVYMALRKSTHTHCIISTEKIGYIQDEKPSSRSSMGVAVSTMNHLEEEELRYSTCQELLVQGGLSLQMIANTMY